MSATEELRHLLDERGVEYTVDDSVKGYLFIVNVKPKKRVFIETWENGGMAIWGGSLTPEQAIAVTLDETYSREDMESVFVSGYSLGTLPVGSDPQWDENRQTVDEHMADLGWVRSATLGSERHAYEQLIVGDGSNWGEIMRDAYDDLMASAGESCAPDEIADIEAHIAATLGGGKLTANDVLNAVYKHGARWQAIADELNAKLGGDTCENIAPDYLDFLCNKCGFVHYHSDENDAGDGNDWNYCPNCGNAVEK